MGETPLTTNGCFSQSGFGLALRRIAVWSPWGVLLTGLLTSAVLWSLLTAGQQRTDHTLLDFRLKAMVEALDASIKSSTSALVRASAWWDELNGTPESAWRNDALAILHDYPAFTGLQLLGRDFQVRWDTALPGGRPASEELDSAGRAAAERARTEDRPVMRLMPGKDGANPRLDIIVPLTDDGRFDGWMRGTLALPSLLDQLYMQLKLTSHLQIYSDGALVQETGNPAAAEHTYATALPIEFADFRLQAVLLPSNEFLSATDSNTPGIVLLVGVIATLMLTGLAHQFIALYTKDRTLAATTGALAAQRRHMESIYNAAPVGLCLFDSQMRYSHVNERMARIYGKLPADLVGRTPREVDEALGARFEPFMNYVLGMGMALENVEVLQESEDEIDGEDGGTRTWLCSFHPAYGADDTVIGIVGAVLDISTLKEAEKEKQDLTSQLFLAQKTEALGRLTGGIAHDFNNMLGVILGSLEFIREMLPDNPGLKASIDRIELAAEHSTDLIRRLLAFARQQPLTPRNVNVTATVENLLPLLQKSLGSNIEIRAAAAADTWIARVDDSQLGSALLNLVINARDAMPMGGSITIETGNAVLDETYVAGESEVYPGEYVVIAVSDTGTGMTPEVLARAFEPFFTTKDHSRGSGLGLSMVFGFIKQSRGHIKIYSEVGHGAVIKLYLPRGVDHLPVATREERPALIRGNEKVLVVEDDALMRDTTVRQLESLGYNVVQASNGKDGLAILNAQPHIDLLLTDVVMPGGLNGPALAKIALELRPKLRVLFVSGYTDNALIEHGWQVAGVHLLQKPFRRADLAAKVHRILTATHFS